MAKHSCGNAHIAHDHEPTQYFQAARKMGIAAARSALAWRQQSLAIDILSGAVLSGTNRSSGS
jgi:hypothetical protein